MANSQKHGLVNDPLYKIYYRIKQQCYNQNNKQYKDLGGKGIKVHGKWVNEFMNFYRWAKGKFAPGMVLVRKNKEKDFTPKNCLFVTKNEFFTKIKLYTNKGVKYSPERIERMRQASLGRKHSEETKKKISQDRMGVKNTKEVLMKRTYSKDDYAQTHPFFCEVEEVRNSLDGIGIEVRCKNSTCRKWFKPTKNQINQRIYALEKPKGFEEHNFYCGSDCKHSCILYNLHSDPYETNGYEGPTDYELKIWKMEVLRRQFEEHGRNFCEYCEEEFDIYHAHHERPKGINPIFSLDPDNGIIACEKHHLEFAHKNECSLFNLRTNKVCK